MKNANIASIKASIRDVFLYWLTFTKPIHNLTDTEIKLVALLLYKRFILSRTIQNEKYLNKALFDVESKEELAKMLDCNITRIHNLLTQLRKKGVLLENIINPKFIPSIELDADSFKIIFNFEISYD